MVQRTATSVIRSETPASVISETTASFGTEIKPQARSINAAPARQVFVDSGRKDEIASLVKTASLLIAAMDRTTTVEMETGAATAEGVGIVEAIVEAAGATMSATTSVTTGTADSEIPAGSRMTLTVMAMADLATTVVVTEVMVVEVGTVVGTEAANGESASPIEIPEVAVSKTADSSTLTIKRFIKSEQYLFSLQLYYFLQEAYTEKGLF